MASAHVDATSFGFGGRGDDVFDSLAEDIEGAIDSVASFPAEVIVGCSSASSSRLDEVGGVGGCFEDHVAGVVSDDCVWVGMKVVHEHVSLVECIGCWGCLFGSDFVEGDVDAGVDGSAVIEEGTVDGLDSYGASFVERGGD